MFTKSVALYIGIILYCILNVAVPELTQIIDSVFPYPYAFCYIYGLLYIPAGILIIMIWKCYRSYFNLSTNIISKQKEYNSLKWFLGYCMLSIIIYQASSLLYIIELEGHMLTVPTDNAISGMQPIPVLMFSVIFLNKKLTVWNIMALIFAIIGILLFFFEVSTHDDQNDQTYDTYTGIMFKIAASTGYALYFIIVKKVSINCLEKDKFIIGNILYIVVVYVMLLVVFPWFLFYPQEIHINVFTTDVVELMFISSCVNFVFIITCYGLIAFTSPFYMSIASTLAIPISFGVDLFIHDYKFNWFAIIGAGFMIMSYVIIEVIKPNDKMCRFWGCCNDENKCESNSYDVKGLLINATENINYGTVRNV